MKWILSVLLLPAMAFAAPTPQNVQHSTLTAEDWGYIASHIAAGDKTWIATVPVLASQANKIRARQLEAALATALPIKTKEVLATLHVMDKGTYPELQGTPVVCVLKVVKPDENATAYYTQTRLALLDDPSGADCLWNLESIWEEARQIQKAP
nr:hypothetical protein [uncultured Enterobacter sp.]